MGAIGSHWEPSGASSSKSGEGADEVRRGGEGWELRSCATGRSGDVGRGKEGPPARDGLKPAIAPRPLHSEFPPAKKAGSVKGRPHPEGAPGSSGWLVIFRRRGRGGAETGRYAVDKKSAWYNAHSGGRAAD